MVLSLAYELHKIKAGYSADCPAVGRLAGHGRTEELAQLNLGRTVRLFFDALSREEGIPPDMAGRLGIPEGVGSDDITIVWMKAEAANA